MVDVVSRKCEYKDCNIHPSFGYESECKRLMCAEHKLDNMIYVGRKMCEYKGCNVHPSFGYENDGIKLRCLEHKKIDMVDVVSKMCIFEGCNTRSNPQYDNYCTHCFSNLFPSDPRTLKIRTKSKELEVVSYILNNHNQKFIHDKPLYVSLDGGCCISKRRMDLWTLINNTILAIEIDEEQRKYHLAPERYNDLFMDFSGKYIFIRYNPDPFRNEKSIKINPQFEERMKKLLSEITNQVSRIKNDINKDLVEIYYLYYHEDII